MEPAAWTVIGTVVGALGGSISSIIVARINQRSQADLLEKNHASEISRLEKSHRFALDKIEQENTLKAQQSKIERLSNAQIEAYKAFLNVVNEFIETINTSQLPDEETIRKIKYEVESTYQAVYLLADSTQTRVIANELHGAILNTIQRIEKLREPVFLDNNQAETEPCDSIRVAENLKTLRHNFLGEVHKDVK